MNFKWNQYYPNWPCKKCPNIFQNWSLRSFRWTIKIILNRTAALLTWWSRTSSDTKKRPVEMLRQELVKHGFNLLTFDLLWCKRSKYVDEMQFSSRCKWKVRSIIQDNKSKKEYTFFSCCLFVKGLIHPKTKNVSYISYPMSNRGDVFWENSAF